MSTKRIIISYPSVAQFLNFIENKGYSNEKKLSEILNDFFESTYSEVCPVIEESDFNILVINTNTKTINSEVEKIVIDYENVVGDIEKQIKVFIINYIYPIDVIGELPQLTHMLPDVIMKRKFNIIVCQNELFESNIVPNLNKYIRKNGILVMDKKKGLNPSEIAGWDYLKLLESYYSFTKRDTYSSTLNYNINKTDIDIDTFLSFTSSLNINNTGLDEYLYSFIKCHLERKMINVELDKNKDNILVMCSNDLSIKRNKYVAILQRCMGSDFDTSNLNIYHLGKNIGYENYPFINRGIIDNFNVTGGYKFDIIISDSCPMMIITSNSNHISKLLKRGCVLIVPKTSKEFDGFQSVSIPTNEYSAFIRL